MTAFEQRAYVQTIYMCLASINEGITELEAVLKYAAQFDEWYKLKGIKL